MILYLLRHASAGKPGSDPRRDEARPLDRTGIEQCRRIGRWMAAQEIGVDAVISSPLKRAAQTAALVANEIGHDERLVLDAALRPEGEFSGLRELLRRHQGAEALLLVGHKPSINVFLGRLISDAGAGVAMRKAGLARIELRGKAARLEWLIAPRLLEPYALPASRSSRPKT